MKVLIVTQYFWPESFSINEVVKSLLEKGVEIEVLTGKPNYPSGKIFNGYSAWGCHRENYQGINVNRIPLIPRGGGGWRLALNYLSFIVSGFIFAPWILRKKKFDVIFIYAPSPILQALPAIFLGWIKKASVVLWVQDLWPDSLSATGHVQNKAILKAMKTVVRYIYKHCDLLLVQSEAFEEKVKELASDTPVTYYPNSVDPSFATKTTCSIPNVAGLDENFPIVFAGNIGSAQAVHVIVEAAILLQEYTDIHFVVLGDGSSYKWMLNESQKHNLTNLHLPGRFPVETMPGFMQKASVLLVTLANKPIFAATIPNKVQAYMAAGRPIVACLNGEGARLVVEAKAGLATEAENSESLSETILNLYKKTAKEREIMGENGRKYYQKHFDHECLIEQLINIFKNEIKNKKVIK